MLCAVALMGHGIATRLAQFSVGTPTNDRNGSIALILDGLGIVCSTIKIGHHASTDALRPVATTGHSILVGGTIR